MASRLLAVLVDDFLRGRTERVKTIKAVALCDLMAPRVITTFRWPSPRPRACDGPSTIRLTLRSEPPAMICRNGQGVVNDGSA
jgi:hypothetical protein